MLVPGTPAAERAVGAAGVREGLCVVRVGRGGGWRVGPWTVQSGRAVHRKLRPRRGWRAPGAASQPAYSSSIVSIATPRRTQNFSLCSGLMARLMVITKFVEWPVVDKTPRRSDVLYVGHG